MKTQGYVEIHSVTDASPPFTHTITQLFTPRGNLKLPIHLFPCFERWEETTEPIGNSQRLSEHGKLHIEEPKKRTESGTL